MQPFETIMQFRITIYDIQYTLIYILFCSIKKIAKLQLKVDHCDQNS